QVPDMGCTHLGDKRQFIGSRQVAWSKHLDESDLGLRNLAPLVALNVLARRIVAQLADELVVRFGDGGIEWRKAGIEQLDVINLYGKVVAVADFTTHRPAGQVGVEADAEQIDIFRVFDNHRARGRRCTGDGAARKQRQAAVVA